MSQTGKIAFVILLPYLALVAFAGCSPNSNKQQAIRIAKYEFQKRGGIGDIECEATKNETNWTVVVWRLPKTAGGFVTVEISPNWSVVGYYSGN